MPELLFEVGCEELPAGFVRRAYEQLEALVCEKLSSSGIPFSTSESLGTPRRLIVCVHDVGERQPDREQEVRGPSAKAAYGPDGQPSQALIGFCRGHGIDPFAVRTEGEYVWITKKLAGQPTVELLESILPECVTKLTFDKAMRWAHSRLRWARPLRWFLASFGQQVVKFEIEGVQSGLKSKGHRFMAPVEFESHDFVTHKSNLRKHFVEPCPAEREKRIRDGATQVCSGTPEMPEPLVLENVFLTEWPVAIEGEFRAEYLDLPEPVLITAMAKHERMFPVRDDSGNITNRFLAIRNSGEDAAVASGNAWVLNARFNDARFFFDEDKKRSLDDFLEATAGMTFQEKLGTVRQRAERLSLLAREVAVRLEMSSEEVALAEQAGMYCKADLSTGLVSELPELQGKIGGVYGRREGLNVSACAAIENHYSLDSLGGISSEVERVTAVVLVADQLDKLFGYLGLGLAPSGSSDPFALRRAGHMLIDTALRWPGEFFNYLSLWDELADFYSRSGVTTALDTTKSATLLQEVFESRYQVVLSDVRHDLLEAALDGGGHPISTHPQGMRFRLDCLTKLAEDPKLVQCLTRPLNLVKSAKAKGIAIETDQPGQGNLDSAEGDSLRAAVVEAIPSISAAMSGKNTAGYVGGLARLQGPINAFFDSTMIMVDDPAVRSTRLELLGQISECLSWCGDLNRVVIE